MASSTCRQKSWVDPNGVELSAARRFAAAFYIMAAAAVTRFYHQH